MLLLATPTGLADREAQTLSESKGVGFCCRVFTGRNPEKAQGFAAA